MGAGCAEGALMPVRRAMGVRGKPGIGRIADRLSDRSSVRILRLGEVRVRRGAGWGAPAERPQNMPAFRVALRVAFVVSLFHFGKFHACPDTVIPNCRGGMQGGVDVRSGVPFPGGWPGRICACFQ